MAKAIDFVVTRDSARFLFDDETEQSVVPNSVEYNRLLAEVGNKQSADMPVDQAVAEIEAAPAVDAPVSETVEDKSAEVATPVNTEAASNQEQAPANSNDVELDPSANPDVAQPTPEQAQVVIEPEAPAPAPSV